MRNQTLIVIALGLAVALFAALPAHHAAASPMEYAPHGTVHCVRYGETLFSIGRLHGVSPWAIAHHNGLVNPNYIRAGQCLRIPGHMRGPVHHPPTVHKPHVPWYPGCYVVMPGDTLTAIGWRFGVSPWAIAHHNGLMNPNYIRAGQCLRIPGRW